MSNENNDFDEDEEQRRLEEEQEEREREAEEREQDMEERQREMEERQEEMENRREKIEYEREKMRSGRHRGHGRGHDHDFPLPPLPPLHGRGHDREEEYFRSRQRKNITIRGIKPELYDEFSNKVQSMNFNLGIVISKMLEAAVSKFNGEFPTLSAKDIAPPKRLIHLQINGKEIIHITKSDLELSEGRIELNRIKKVIIDNNVTDELLKRHIESINDCELVRFPKTIPKLVALSLLNHCKYEFY